MPDAQQDTEITLGTGRMLAIFFVLVLVCAFFFAIGFSFGRKSAVTSAASSTGITAGSSAPMARPSAAKNGARETPQSPQPGDFGFYKAVGEKNADTALTPDSKAESSPAAAAPATAEAPPKPAPDTASATPSGAGYYVQVAAVSRQEDAEALVEALKKKQYPAFVASNPSADKFYHVQVGPCADVKEAEAVRARLIADGYNPIVKK